MNSKKLAIARILKWARLSRALLRLQRGIGFPYIRAVNYHDVPPSSAEAFQQQLAFFSEVFEAVGPAQLGDLFAGRWNSDRPGILISFDDGLRSHAEVVAPLLEQFGLTGWFMVPGGFLSEPAQEQVEYARRHSIQHDGFDYGDPRIAMTWNDARYLSKRHVVGCHTWSHRRLDDSLDESEVNFEVNLARARMQAKLETAVTVFAWVGGDEDSYSWRSAEAVSDAGYHLSFMTNTYPIRPGTDPLWLQRTNIEAFYPMDLVRFQLSGLMDIQYAPKRYRIAKRLARE